jgi:diguanylate cyclase (GGDEF)-like protein
VPLPVSKKGHLAQLDLSVIKKIEGMLRLLEREEAKFERLKKDYDRSKSSNRKANEHRRKFQNENRILKKRITGLQEQIDSLNGMLEGIQLNYQISAEASVDLLSDLEYNRYKSRFIDIDIEYPPGLEKLREYGKNMKSFFINDMHCTFICIQCKGITQDLQNLLNIKFKKKQKDSASFLFDRSKVYYFDLEDMDLPERKLGRIIVGRYPYKSREKEMVFDLRIESEILISKRLLEKGILEIQNKELAIKDALTGLHSRKFLVERLSEEFKSMDVLDKLNAIEHNLLKIIMKSEGVAATLIRQQYFSKYKTRDEVVFGKAIHRLKSLNIVSVDSVKYMGEKDDSYFFENSKISYDLFVALLDLDHFKDVNDNWGGHSVGDKVLREFADIIKKNIRTTDLPVRYGGEEFIIMFPRSNNSSRIIAVLDNIRLDCERKLLVSWNGKKRNVTVSVGLTQINKFDMNIHYIINRADAALYKAKKKRNRIISCTQDDEGELLYKIE